MAINKKLIHFNNKITFNSQKLSANASNTQYQVGGTGAVQTGAPDINYQSIVYIRDSKEIWTHGQFYATAVTWSTITGKPSFATVATSGNYNDLTNKPTIPTSLPTPNSLTFTGATTGTWNGSAAKTVNIPTYSNASTSSAGLMSTSDKSKLDGIASGAEVNQNAFSNVVVGSTTIAADSKTGTLTLTAGSNITLTPNATNDSITISASGSSYSLPLASNSTRGGIKLSSSTQGGTPNGITTTSGRTYAVQVNSSEQAVVNVPWTDTIYTLPTASASTLGGVKVGSGLAISNGVLSATDTKNTAGATNSSNRLYLIGATSQGANPQTYSKNGVYIEDNGILMSLQGFEGGTITSTAAIYAANGFFDTSDARVKTNVVEIDASKADAIKLVEFDRTDKRHHGYGVIAQELEKVYPEMVNTDSEGFKSVNYNELAMVKIKYLEDKVARLEALVGRLLAE